MIGFSNAVFASNKTHALAMIRWLDLEPGIWHANSYGAKLRDRYDKAILVRPVDGVTQDHFAWISGFLIPRMKHSEHITILHWRYDEFPCSYGLDEAQAYDPYASVWT